ncbi:MAG TPA: DUF445 domain-containing protein [Alphaproteobacteria bacterium]
MEASAADRDLAQRRALRRNRAAATTLLLVMVGGYIATAMVTAPDVWLALIHATAEAGVVGGLADWFAVTALFRRPLGLPIPHTAIIPRNKDRIGEGLGTFVERHFLTEELLLAKLGALNIATRLAGWLADEDHARLVADKVAAVLPHVAAALDDEELRTFTAEALGIRLRDIDVAPLVGKALAVLTAGGYHAAVLDRGIELARDFLDRNAEQLEQAAANGARRRWWIPAAVNKRIARAILLGLRELLEDLQTPDSKVRRRALAAVDDATAELATSPQYRARLETAKHELLDRPEIQAWLGSVWDQIRDLVLADLAASPSQARDGLATALASLGRALLADEGMRARLNKVVESAMLGLLAWRGELAGFIGEVVRQWDEKVLVQRMELALGADLQYVRFTGTLVGAAIGCLLFLLPSLVQQAAVYVGWP